MTSAVVKVNKSPNEASDIKRSPFKIFSIRSICETKSPPGPCIFRERKQMEPRRYLFFALIFTHTSCLNISELSVDWDEIGFVPEQTRSISHIFSYRFQQRTLDCQSKELKKLQSWFLFLYNSLIKLSFFIFLVQFIRYCRFFIKF